MATIKKGSPKKTKRPAKKQGRPAVLYKRVSTAEQAEEGVSLKMQESRGKRHATLQGWQLLSVESDPARSGRTTNRRPGLERALQQVCEHRGVLIVYSLSRMARSVRDAFAIVDRLRESGADLVSLTEPIDTTSPMGKAFFGILAVLAELESDLTSERVRAAMEHKRRERKRWFGGRIPYGWRMSADGSHVVQVRSEQANIAKMRRWRKAGKGFGWIAQRLQRAGAKTKQGKKSWGRMTIRRILLIDERLQKLKRHG